MTQETGHSKKPESEGAPFINFYLDEGREHVSGTLVQLKSLEFFIVTATEDLTKLTKTQFTPEGEGFILGEVVEVANPLASERVWDPRIFSQIPQKE